MKYIVLASVFLLFFHNVFFGQEAGIKFETGLSWHSILSKAKKENKYIFMDCFTTWCGPCKYMSQNIFTQPMVGQYFNKNFINVAVQMDQDIKDSRFVQSWYADAKSINTAYGVSSYPTYLFFSPDGIVMHRMVGSTKNADEFLRQSAEALIKQKQYYTAIGNYKQHAGDSTYLRNSLNRTISLSDNVTMSGLADLYMDCIKDTFCRDNLDILAKVFVFVAGRGKTFGLFYNNAPRIDSVMNNIAMAEDMVMDVIIEREIDPLFERNDVPVEWSKILIDLATRYPLLADRLAARVKPEIEYEIVHTEIKPFFKDGALSPDWDKIAGRINIRCHGYDADQILASNKYKYYKYKSSWDEYKNSLLLYLKRYRQKLMGDSEGLNKILWEDIFLVSDDPDLLSEGLNLAKINVGTYRFVPGYIDTYANLLFKTGDVANAILWEQRSVELANILMNIAPRSEEDPQSLKDIQANLEKMKKGEKTW